MKPFALILCASLLAVSCKSAPPYVPGGSNVPPAVTNGVSLAWTPSPDTNSIGTRLYVCTNNVNWLLLGQYPNPITIAPGILTNQPVGTVWTYTAVAYTAANIESTNNPQLTNAPVAPLPVPAGVPGISAK